MLGAHSGAMNSWGVRGTLAAMGVAVVVAGVGGAAVYGATAEGPRMGPPHGGPPPGRQAGFGSAPTTPSLHSEIAVADGSGVVTKLTQTGRLIALSPTAVTVRSSDDFTSTYVLPPGAGTPAVRVGDDVEVAATREGEAAVIRSIDQISRPPLSAAG